MANIVLMARAQPLARNETPSCGGTEWGPGRNSTSECATKWLLGFLGLCRGDGERGLSVDLSMTAKGVMSRWALVSDVWLEAALGHRGLPHLLALQQLPLGRGVPPVKAPPPHVLAVPEEPLPQNQAFAVVRGG